MGVSETGIAVALRVVGVVRASDVPSDLLGPVAGYHDNNTGVRREGSGDGRGNQRLTRDGDGACVAGAMIH